MRSLSPARWRQLDALFVAALEHVPEERAAFVDVACGGDPALRRELRALLDGDAAAARALGESALDFAAPILAAARPAPNDDALAPGRRLGAYRVVREIGRGGMGAVYLAERADAQFEKRVAVKLVKRGMDTDEVLRRFRAERQIMAALEHPGIARLYDGGVSDDGRPFLVMEYVDGRPLDAHCDERRLDVAHRLALFVRVCDAVQFAHRSLVVHRDLKPSNVLVTADGEPKLLDFGIAKLLDPAAPADTLGAPRRFTPDYASPEQLVGAPVTTASDVYGLGVVLHHLLTGQRPFAALDVAHREPRPPSEVVRANGAGAAARGTTPERLARQLRGDLDAIVLRALEREPARRYESPRQLADDVERHLAGVPVLARRATRAYRIRRWLRRHRAGALTALAFVALAASFAAFYSVRITRARALAERQRDKAEQVVGFLTSMLAAADPSEAQGDTLTVHDVLARSEARLDTALAAQPEVRAELLRVLGETYGSLGDLPRAARLLERAYTLGRASRGADDSAVVDVLRSLEIAVLRAGKRDSAERLARRVLAARRARFGEWHPLVGAALNDLGDIRWTTGDFDSTAALFERARLVASQGKRVDTAVLSQALYNLGVLRRAQGRFAEAAPPTREALALRRRQLGADHPDVATTAISLAAVVMDAGSFAAAESLFRETVAVRRRVRGPAHTEVASALMGLGYALQRQRRWAAAESTFREMLAIHTRTLGPRHPEIGVDLYTLGSVLEDRGDAAEAERFYRQSIALLEGVHGREHPHVTSPLVALGRLLVDVGRAGEGEPLLRRAAASRRAMVGARSLLTVGAEAELGWSLARQGRLVEAESLMARSHAAWRARTSSRDSIALRRLRAHLADTYARLGQPARATEYRALLAAASR